MTVQCTRTNPAAFETGRMSPRDSRVFRPGGLELTAHALGLAELGAGTKVLDLGCGSGVTLNYLDTLGIDAVGVDCLLEAPSGHDGETKPRRIAASAEALPFPNESQDGVLLECTLSLIQDQTRVLAECARVLVDGGRLVISDLYARRPEAIAHVRALNGCCATGMLVREELSASLETAGFEIEVWEDHSRELRECAARYIFEYGTTDGLWNCGEQAVDALETAMRSARAGYFLLIARRQARVEMKGKVA